LLIITTIVFIGKPAKVTRFADSEVEEEFGKEYLLLDY
jgi:hypothetical protein